MTGIKYQSSSSITVRSNGSSTSTQISNDTSTQSNSSTWRGKKWVQEGQKGKAATWVKQQLVAGGYLTAAQAKTPTFDKVATAALKAFQAKNGLTADGMAGSKTFAKLNAAARQRDTFQDAIPVPDSGSSTKIADTTKLEFPDSSVKVSAAKMVKLAKEADALGNGDGSVSSKEWSALKTAKLSELNQAAASGDSSKASSAGEAAGIAANAGYAQDRIDDRVAGPVDLNAAILEAIDTSAGIGNGDGQVTRKEAADYVTKLRASGDSKKATYADIAEKLFKNLPIRA